MAAVPEMNINTKKTDKQAVHKYILYLIGLDIVSAQKRNFLSPTDIPRYWFSDVLRP